MKQYCDITGYIAPQNKFELRLPLASDWNQKFLFSACGGFCGSVNGTGCNSGLARGYASATSNGGHDSSPGFDGVWAANAPNLQEDYGWRSNHVVTLVAKFITTHYYGQPIKRSYMTGCSKGGQAVLLEAQKFPEDYDGLMPIAPVYDFTGRAVAGAWFAQAVTDGRGGSVLDTAAVQAIHKSVLKACGAQAGVDEGLVTDPVNCKWQPELIACAPGSIGSDCLTPEQVTAVKRLMTPVKNSKGEVVYAYPYIPGTETECVFWNFAVQSSAGGAPEHGNYKVAHQYLSFLADEKPRKKPDPLKFNFDKDTATLARARRIYDATSYDLRTFKARGGKMLLWHGMADGGIMATSSIGYYEGVMKLMGGRKQTEDFFRMFLIPGVHHCAGGPGLTEFDALTLLENWVENGQAPEVLITTRPGNGGVERSRPVYAYPILARYSGKGDPKQATSFVWVDAGAPEGSPAPEYVPTRRETGWKLGKPDIVVQVPGFQVPKNGQVPYSFLIVPKHFDRDTWVRAAEFRIDQRAVIHHINAFVRQPGSSYLAGFPENRIFVPTLADRRKTREGERLFERRQLLLGYEPGYAPMPWLEDGAKLIKAGSDIIFEMHYNPNGKEVTDYSEFGLYLAKTAPPLRILAIDTLRDLDLNLPPGERNCLSKASMTLAKPARLLSIQPHMHMHVRGKSMTVRAAYADGAAEDLLRVPKYDFNWQITYVLKQPLDLPAGTRLDSVAGFDNSADNPFNPDPGATVRWGDQTTEEMHIAFLELIIDAAWIPIPCCDELGGLSVIHKKR